MPPYRRWAGSRDAGPHGKWFRISRISAQLTQETTDLDASSLATRAVRRVSFDLTTGSRAAEYCARSRARRPVEQPRWAVRLDFGAVAQLEPAVTRDGISRAHAGTVEMSRVCSPLSSCGPASAHGQTRSLPSRVATWPLQTPGPVEFVGSAPMRTAKQESARTNSSPNTEKRRDR